MLYFRLAAKADSNSAEKMHNSEPVSISIEIIQHSVLHGVPQAQSRHIERPVRNCWRSATITQTQPTAAQRFSSLSLQQDFQSRGVIQIRSNKF
jgi:hypothetical protein